MVSSISVIGLGKLGSPMVACFAAAGFRVSAADVDAKKIAAIRDGIAPVHEPALQELLRESGGRITATENVEEAVRATDATFIVVATPSQPGGDFSLSYALSACEAIGRALREKSAFHLVVLTSTVMPGSTGGEIKAALEATSGKRCGVDFGLCYNPEFIALGSVIRDFYNPDFLLIGESDVRSGDLLTDIYRRTCKNSPSVARMNFVNAEITKLSVNTYITTKMSYANMLARLCERLPEADVNVVTDALGLDTRIGSKYLKGAVSYGGPCFPRDNRAFAALAARVGAFSDLAQATDVFNRAQISYFAGIAKQHLSGKTPLGILGLTYKPQTDVVEEAFGYLLAQELGGQGIAVHVFDPEANLSPAFRQLPNITIAESAAACVAKTETVLLATPWPEFRALPVEVWKGRTVIDCWQAVTHLRSEPGVNYVRLGYGGSASPEKEHFVAQRG